MAPDGNRFTVRFASLRILAVGAAIAGRNRIAVRASFRMPQKCADALVELRADDVLKLAGLVVGFGIFNREGVPEESLGEAVAADDVAGAAAAAIGELHFAAAPLHQAPSNQAAQAAAGVPFPPPPDPAPTRRTAPL